MRAIRREQRFARERARGREHEIVGLALVLGEVRQRAAR